MLSLALLWLPILLSAAFVFVVSSVMHMVLPIHLGDYAKVPNEDETRRALREAAIPPGQYMFPHAGSLKEAGSDEMQAKFTEGPVGVLILRAHGTPKMGKPLLQWFAFCLLVGVFVAYLTALTLGAGASYGEVFRVSATIATLGYAFSSVNDSIWKGVSWSVTAKFVFDGLVYALVTAGTFAWLWPDAA